MVLHQIPLYSNPHPTDRMGYSFWAYFITSVYSFWDDFCIRNIHIWSETKSLYIQIPILLTGWVIPFGLIFSPQYIPLVGNFDMGNIQMSLKSSFQVFSFTQNQTNKIFY